MKNKKVKIPKIKDDEILVVKVGTDERPSGPDDLKAIQMLLTQASLDKSLCLVTHHAVEFVTIKRSLLKKGIVYQGMK